MALLSGGISVLMWILEHFGTTVLVATKTDWPLYPWISGV